MRKGLIVTGGKLDIDFARSFIKQCSFDKVIAVDGGLASADALGLVPDYIVGDFDTAAPQLIEKYKELPFIIWDVHQPRKNETDTELARSRAIEIGCEEIAFLGATGGRADHMLGNIHVLYGCLEKGVEAYLIDTQNKIYLLDEGKTFYQKNVWGKYISFLPYSEVVSGISLRGFKYPLDRREIRHGKEVGLCISNELVESKAVLTFDTGILVCVESHD